MRRPVSDDQLDGLIKALGGVERDVAALSIAMGTADARQSRRQSSSSSDGATSPPTSFGSEQLRELVAMRRTLLSADYMASDLDRQRQQQAEDSPSGELLSRRRMIQVHWAIVMCPTDDVLDIS